MAKNTNNYFTSSINKYNTEDFVTLMAPEEIQRDCKRIVREIIKGKIDFTKWGRYFQDPKFTDNLLIACEAEFNFNTQNVIALKVYDLQFPGSKQVWYNSYVSSVLATCYGTVLNRLQALKMSMYENIGILTDIPVVLRDYKNFDKL